MFEALLKTALLGTRQPRSPADALPEDLAALLADRRPENPEADLLVAVAATTLYARAGLVSQRGTPRPSVSEPDVLPECSSEMADLFAQLLDAKLWELVGEWLEIAGQTGQRLPSSLLPRLLELAANHPPLRSAALRIADSRGRWLMQFNPTWQFATETVSEDLWQTGTRDQRTAVLAQVRLGDPVRARTLVAATWDHDPAEERARWVEAFAEGLSPLDEPFLESCLDDRSSRVREAAADLLSRLPGSMLVARMIGRAMPLLNYVPGSAGNLLLLKKAVKPRLEVDLPVGFDKMMLRDGLKEKTNESIGVRQWHLMQILSHVPLAHWTERFGATPDELISAVPDEFDTVLSRGWATRFARGPEPDWTLPLIEHYPPKWPMPPDFLPAVPAPQRESAFRQLMKREHGGNANHWALAQLLTAWRPLDPGTSAAIASEFELSNLLDYDVWRVLHPSALGRLEARLEAAPEAMRRKLDQALSEIALRRRIHRELH